PDLDAERIHGAAICGEIRIHGRNTEPDRRTVARPGTPELRAASGNHQHLDCRALEVNIPAGGPESRGTVRRRRPPREVPYSEREVRLVCLAARLIGNRVEPAAR